MSYILNALKKAERDRLREDPKELDDFASPSWDPYEQSIPSNRLRNSLIVSVVALLSIALTVIGMGYLNTPSPSSSLQSEAPAMEVAPSQTDFHKSEPVAMPEHPTPPMQLSAEIPLLTISGHMYFSEGSPSNRLFANDQSYRETDSIAEGWVLAKIGLEGIEIRSGDKSAFLPYP
jgi:hypothetical protein